MKSLIVSFVFSFGGLFGASALAHGACTSDQAPYEAYCAAKTVQVACEATPLCRWVEGRLAPEESALNADVADLTAQLQQPLKSKNAQ